MLDESVAAVHQLLFEQPNLKFFYVINLVYSSGSMGDSAFHSLATDPQICRATIQQLCAEQKAKLEQKIAEIAELPENEEPYDPLLPDGCTVSLCILLPDEHYIPIQSQRWDNRGKSPHPADTPDIFDVAYYCNPKA